MSRRARLFRAQWVLPVVGPAIAHGEILVDPAGRIAAVAPAGALDLPEPVEIRDLGSAILLPGLVNVHTHPELAMFRGALEDLAFRDWILRLVGTKRSALLPEDSAAAAEWTMVEATRAGITTLGATEASGAAVASLRDSGLRGVVYQEVFGPDPREAAASLRQLMADVDRRRAEANDRVRIGISPHAPYTVSDDLYRGAVRFARDESLPLAVHIAESRAERDLVVEGAGDFAPGLRARGIETRPRAPSPIRLLELLGVLDQRPLLIHCVDVDDEDIEVIARSGASVAHCPIANAKLGHGLAPLTRLRSAGVPVGIGTDSVGSNNRLDLLEEARTTALLHRASARRFDLLPPRELLELCTMEGARALGMADRIGSLAPGKEADLCAVALDAPATVPCIDPLATLFHAARASDVVLTVVGGEVLYECGTFRTLRVEDARSRLEAAAGRVRAAL